MMTYTPTAIKNWSTHTVHVAPGKPLNNSGAPKETIIQVFDHKRVQFDLKPVEGGYTVIDVTFHEQFPGTPVFASIEDAIRFFLKIKRRWVDLENAG